MPPCTNSTPLIFTTPFSVRSHLPYGPSRPNATRISTDPSGVSFNSCSRSSAGADSTNRCRMSSDRAGGERRVLAWRREPQIAEHAHDLVIPEQRVHGAAGARGLLVETLEQVERLPRVRTAVDDIAQLDEVGLSGRPPQPGVDDLRRTENRDQPIVGAVHIADGDDPLDAIDGAGRGGGVQGTAGARRHQQRQRGDGDERASNSGPSHELQG